MIVNEGPDAVGIAEAALAAGVKIVQYRAKGTINEIRLKALRRSTRAYAALLILNDDWRAAKETDCDGVHLGPEDDGFSAPGRIRAAFPDAIVGLSCATIAEVQAAQAAGADYAGVGSVYATSSKYDAGLPIGIEALHEIVRATALPIAAIGGITQENVREVKRAGAAMAAVISAVAQGDEVYAARHLVRAWNET